MSKEMSKIFQIAVVFIGTIVGAGLASGQEILSFFTSYGIYSFVGIIFCSLFYIVMGSIVSKISIKYNLTSYGALMTTVSPNILGKLTGGITTLYLLSSSSIILAGSGALLNQFFSIPKFVGSILMVILALFFLFRDTDGLIEVNSFIVPILIITITLITSLYFIFCRDIISFSNLSSFPPKKSGIMLSAILYSGYNTLCSLGVLVPLSTKINNRKTLFYGISLGVIGLCILSFAINLLLMANQPYVYTYEIPLLMVSQRFGTLIQALLLAVIWLEMFSTEISDIYSISKTLNATFNISFKKCIFIVILIALPISNLGFSNLISILYPFFGALSLVFILQTIIFYFKNIKSFQ